MSKFGTTSSHLFTNKIDANVPDWMLDLRDNVTQYTDNKQNIDIQFDKVGAFETQKINERQNLNATPRDTIASLNNQKLTIESKMELAKFLNNKYYKTAARIVNNTAYLDTTIDGIQANFVFEYNFEDGRVKQASTFLVNETEYPFSKAGLEECLSDIKNGTLDKCKTKVASSREAYIINREEIIRRYNGSIREASNQIETYLQEGTIVGVGSNSYASYYDPDEIFPKMVKDIPNDRLGSFEYVNNTEHVATNEHKSAKNLQIEASKILSNVFNDFIITQATRDNNELLVNATVLSDNGKRCNVSFNFNIENEKVASLVLAEIDNKRMSVKDLLTYINSNNQVVNKFLANKEASKRIYNGTIISHIDLKRQLSELIPLNQVEDFIDSLVNMQKIAHINNTTYASKYTIAELLNMVNCESLTDEQINKRLEYSSQQTANMNRIAQADTGIRDMETVVNENTKLYSANNYISQHFKNYVPVKFTEASNTYTIKLFDESTGLSTNIDFILDFDGNKIKDCKANINNKLVSLSNVKTAFAKNEILNKYLQVTSGKHENSSIIFTTEDLTRRLNKISNITKDEVNKVISQWESSNKLIKLNTNMYGSKYSIEQLISMSNIKPLSDDEIVARLMRGKQNKNLIVTSAYIKDSDTREMQDKWSANRMMLFAKDEISMMFKNFDIVDASLTDKGYTVTAKLINPFNGLKVALDFNFESNNSKLSKLASISNGTQTVSKNNIIKLLDVKDEIINQYNKFNGINKSSNKIVISNSNLKSKLASVIDIDNYNNIINHLVENNIITQIGTTDFASEYSVSDIVSYLKNNNMTNTENIYTRLASYNDKTVVDLRGPKVFDTDNRKIEKPEAKLSPDMINTANKIRKITQASLNNKKITNNKYNQIMSNLDTAKTPSDIENIWREIKRYI